MSPRVGEALRDARTRRRVDLDEVERATKIRTKFLIAMEEDRWGDLPAPAYARGFLSTYARFLGLDERALLDEYRRTTGDAERPEAIPPRVLKPSGAGRGRRRSIFGPTRSLKPAALLLPGLILVGLLAMVIVMSLGGSDEGDGEREASVADRETREPAPAEEGSPAPGKTVEVELRSIGPVWVCLVDGRGRALVNGETLVSGERRGPFDGPLFAVTFGNGSIEMTVDGEPVRIPAVAEPLGYRISASGLRELEPSSQPTCG